MEPPDGKACKRALTSFIKSDSQWLEFPQPGFAVDLSVLTAEEALPQMGCTAAPLRTPSIGLIMEVKVGTANVRIFLDPKQKNTIPDVEPADRAGLKLTAAVPSVDLSILGAANIRKKAGSILGADLLPASRPASTFPARSSS